MTSLRSTSSSGKIMRSLKAYFVSTECPSAMCANSCDSTMAREASSGNTSSKPRLITIVCPIVKVSSGVVSSTRQRTSGWMLRLLVTSKLFTTACSTLEASPSGARTPARSMRSSTLSSASRCHFCWLSIGLISLAPLPLWSATSLAGDSTCISVNSVCWPECFKS